MTSSDFWHHTSAIDHTFYVFTGSARDLQAFLVFFQHPKWVITPPK